jgi:hypothetical protein
MALDDGAQVDPATLPENIALMAQIDEQLAQAASARERQLALAARIADLVPTASGKIEEHVIARRGPHAKEEDLRGALVEALRARGELVLTEAKLAVPGWTPNLGGFDIAVVVQDSLVVVETNWADGNLRESMWDIFKLASAVALPRVDAAVAVYGAPVNQWHKPQTCTQLFEDRAVIVPKLIEALPADWTVNLAGSNARPHAIPMLIRVTFLNATAVEVLGRDWEVRAVAVMADGATCSLEDGWPHGAAPAAPQPYPW